MSGVNYEGQSGLIQPKDRKYKEHGLKREEHIEFKNDNCSHALRTSVIPVTAISLKSKCKRLKSLVEKTSFEDGGENIPLVNDYIKVIGNYSPSGHDASRIVDSDGIAPTVKENHGTVTAILESTNESQKEITLKSKDKRLRNLVNNTKLEEGKVMNLDLYNQTTNENISQCLTEPNHNSQRLFDGLRIRKLTPKECWRLMGFDDSDFEKAEKENSNTQLYKQAGNSIVVKVLEKIFQNLL